MKIVVSEAAAADLARLHAFLAGKNAAAAARAVTALIAAVQSLDTFPDAIHRLYLRKHSSNEFKPRPTRKIRSGSSAA
jgi:plasmid stabilization system protein ParE